MVLGQMFRDEVIVLFLFILVLFSFEDLIVFNSRIKGFNYRISEVSHVLSAIPMKLLLVSEHRQLLVSNRSSFRYG